jgi:hypothetical protein
MRLVNEKLEKAIKLGQLIDAKLAVKLERELPAGDPRRAFVENEWLFPCASGSWTCSSSSSSISRACCRST